MLLEAIDSSRSQICRPHILLEKTDFPGKLNYIGLLCTPQSCNRLFFHREIFAQCEMCFLKKITKNNYIENAKILKKKRVFMGKKLALKLGIQTYQILANDDEVSLVFS